MLKKKNAQGISVHVIIIAVIALIVLIVLIAIFTGKFGEFSKGIGSFGNPSKTCWEQTGSNPIDGKCPIGTVQITSRDSIAKGNKCCIARSSISDGKSQCKAFGACAGECRAHDGECGFIEDFNDCCPDSGDEES